MTNTPPRKVSEPQLPDIQKCPRCGANILIGDTHCSQCGYDVRTLDQRIKGQPPMVVSGSLFVIGVLFALAATGMENPLRAIALLIGFGLIVAGGLYYAADLLILNANDRRKPNGKK